MKIRIKNNNKGTVTFNELWEDVNNLDKLTNIKFKKPEIPIVIDEDDFDEKILKIRNSELNNKSSHRRVELNITVPDNCNHKISIEANAQFEVILAISNKSSLFYQTIGMTRKVREDLINLCEGTKDIIVNKIAELFTPGIHKVYKYDKGGYYIIPNDYNRIHFKFTGSAIEVTSILFHHDDKPNDEGVYSKEAKDALTEFCEKLIPTMTYPTELYNRVIDKLSKR